jgi:ferritin
VREQVEEEGSANEILQKLQLIGTDTSLLFILDGELGKRAAK